MKRIDKPRPGFFAMKLTKGGAEIGARIFRPCACTVNGPGGHIWNSSCDRYPLLMAEINGEEAAVSRVWLYGREIAESEYQFLINDGAWARDNAPDDPRANPNEKINLGDLAPIF